MAFETTINFYQTTRRNIAEGSHFHTDLRKNLKSCDDNLSIYFQCMRIYLYIDTKYLSSSRPKNV
jgi:hypothetical protein